MNQDKIGKFIATMRKEKKLTQEELAEKLQITNRAISKWERGLSMPDTSIMLSLCEMLDIKVSELLKGERIDMKENNKKVEELLLELTRQEEIKNKKLMFAMWTILTLTIILSVSILFLAAYFLEEGPLLAWIIIGTLIVNFISALSCLMIEREAGYYDCKHCQNKFIPSLLELTIVPHIVTTRYLKCPKCHKRSWCKKVMTK